MTRLSRFKLRPQIKGKYIGRLSKGFFKQKPLEKLEIFLSHLLTDTEIETFAKRLEIIKQLRKGSTYWSIKDDVKVTNATITKMHNILMRADEEFLRSLGTLIKEDNLEEELEKRSKYSKGSKQVYARRVR